MTGWYDYRDNQSIILLWLVVIERDTDDHKWSAGIHGYIDFLFVNQ